MTKPNFSNLQPDSPELEEAQQLYEDFQARQAEEHMLLEKEKMKTKDIKPELNKLEPRHIKEEEENQG